MLTTTTILSLILISNIIVCLIILSTNPKRSQNRFFTLFSFIISAWILFVLGVMHAKTQPIALFFIRGASIAGAWIPSAFYLLCLSISTPNRSLRQYAAKARIHLLLGVLISLMCCTKFFIKDVVLPSDAQASITVPDAIYGHGFIIFALYFPFVLTVTIYNFAKILRMSTGIVREELQFVIAAMALAIPISLLIHITAVLLDSSQPQQYGPICIIPINLVIAYGIATRRILGIATVLRQIASISILICYIILSYIMIWLALRYSIGVGALENSLFLQLLTTLTIVLTVSPIHRRLNRAAERIMSPRSVDFQHIMKESGDVFRKIATIESLLTHFVNTLRDSLNTRNVSILTPSKGAYHAVKSLSNPEKNAIVRNGSPIVQLITISQSPVCLDSLGRIRQTAQIQACVKELTTLRASLAIGFFSGTGLNGLVLIGPRTNGQIYDRNEQDALQLLCNQFAVQLENARLYTEMQDNKIRNAIMLDQLVSGVVVASPERRVTLFNHEAQRITGIGESEAMGEPIDILPGPIVAALDATLAQQAGMRNVDASLFAQAEDEGSVHVRMGSAYLFGHDEKPMGALLVFTDTTELKSLEEQVRRSDQLSSVGTLAAGMAHEIKNPLVTIKTFTQLLPQRYADADFRVEFSTLVAQEVARIDGIVNDLLSFSKPATPHLVPMRIQTTIDQTLKLLHEQMVQKDIAVRNLFRAESDQVLGDAKLLSQALVNLCLNAIEAIGKDGTITVGTLNCNYRFANGEGDGKGTLRRCIRLQISDTGKGIEPRNLSKIFDPFFTGKSEGTGMGLSVAHGIIREHHGAIEVESEPGRGATFFVYLPVHEHGGSA